MTDLARKLPDAPAVSDAIRKARARGLELVADNLPKVADATDRAGKSAAAFIRTSADGLSKKIRKKKPAATSQLGSLLASSWLLRNAGRIVARHPVALLVGGAAIAAVGVAAWRLSQSEAAQSAAEDEDEIADAV